MPTDILKSFSHLQGELEEARNSLKGVDENIKRLIGRDPSEVIPRTGQKRQINQDDKNNRYSSKIIRKSIENDDLKRRNNPNPISVFKRLSEKVYEEPIKHQPRGLISKVIAAPKEIPSRQDVLDKQNRDEKFKARNKRMFGALLGTLQRFQQEETKLKKKEEKRTQIEKKIEEHEQQEKEEIKKERQELFLNRKKKQQEIKMIELKMLRMKEYAAWEDSQKPRTSFLLTKAKPHIHYLPRKMTEQTRELLNKSRANVEEQIEKRRQEVFDELNHIEERMKKNFESKNNIETKEEPNTIRHDRHDSESDVDEDNEMKMSNKSPPHDEGEMEEVGDNTSEKKSAEMDITEKDENKSEHQNDNIQNGSEPINSDISMEHSIYMNHKDTLENNRASNLEHNDNTNNSTVETNTDLQTNNSVDVYDPSNPNLIFNDKSEEPPSTLSNEVI